VVFLPTDVFGYSSDEVSAIWAVTNPDKLTHMDSPGDNQLKRFVHRSIAQEWYGSGKSSPMVNCAIPGGSRSSVWTAPSEPSWSARAPHRLTPTVV